MKNLHFIALALLIPAVSSTAVAQQKGLRVLVASPRGELASTDQANSVFVTFDQPMVPLGAVSSQEGTGIMGIRPQISGKFRWMGTTTLAFLPSQRFLYATEYTARIAGGTKSLSGVALDTAFEWTFQTPRPHVLNTTPRYGSSNIELDHSIIIEFDQPVDPQIASRFISIQEKSRDTVQYPSYAAWHPEKKWVRGDSIDAVVLTPSRPFSKGSVITVTCKTGLPGLEGSLGMAYDFVLTFSTYGELSFLGLNVVGAVDPASSIAFRFSNEVPYKELATHLWFEPTVRMPDHYLDESYASTEVDMSLPLLAEKKYRGVVKAGLKDRFGNALQADAPFEFRTEAFEPSLWMPTGPAVLEAYESHRYPVTFMNTDSARVRMGVVNPDQIVAMMRRLDFSRSSPLTVEKGMMLKPAGGKVPPEGFPHVKTWHIKVPRNYSSTRPLNLDAVLLPATSGVVLAQINGFEEKPEHLKALIQVTNMGITAKFSPDAQLIWVTNLKDASPVVSAAVEIRNDSNEVVWKGTTDRNGLASAPGWGKLALRLRGEGRSGPGESEEEEEYYYSNRSPQQWVIVRKGGDVAFTMSKWDDGIEPWRFGIASDWSPQPDKHEGVLFTDRGLYKVGEKVEIKGIVRVRQNGAWHIGRGMKARFIVKDSRDQEILSSEPSLSSFGAFALTVPLSPSASLGRYSMQLSVREGSGRSIRWKNVASDEFRVEAFRTLEFEVTAGTDRKEYILGDTLVGYLSARYLFGAPLKREPVQWRMSVSPSQWVPPGYDGYFFGPLDWLSRYGEGSGYRLLSSHQETLDESGSMTVRAVLRPEEIRRTSSLLLEGDVTSPSRQVISGRTSVLVHAGEFSIGIRPRATFVTTDSALSYSIVTVAPDGKPTPGQGITIRVFRRVWNSVRKAETGGRYTWVSEESDSLSDSTAVTTGTGPTERTFMPRRGGFYYIEARANDRRGNAVLTNAYFYVSGSSYVAWERFNDDRITLVADRERYAPGQVAHVMVKSPYEKAPALVSLEREGVLRHYTVTLAGSAPQIDIPVTEAMLPNVFLSVVLLQGRVSHPSAAQTEDIGRPSFKIGYLNLPVSPKHQELQVSLKTPASDFKPGDSVHLSLQVNNNEGHGVAAEVAVSVADLGVLNLINYRMPNPFDFFYRERPLAVTTTETRMNLIEQREYGEKGEDDGGGGAEAPPENMFDAEGVRRDFRPSAYWNPSVLTDSTGQASVCFKLPDNLTGFQAMAVAQTRDSRFGYGQNSFTVSKPLLLQPSLPHFARVGDSFEGGVVLLNNSALAKTVRVVAKARGIRMAGGDTTTHLLHPGQAREVVFSFTAERIGKAVLTVRAFTDTDTDGLQWTFPIDAPRLSESVALYESTTEDRVEEAVVPPDSIYRDVGEIELTAASTAMVGLSGGMSYLFTYPYGCLEQRCSAVLPLVLAKDLVEAFHFEVFKRSDYREVITKTLGEIPLFQRGNGGFSYWKNSSETWPFVSAYATYTLVLARKKGYAVDAEAISEGLSYLHRVLTGEEKSDHYTYSASQCTRAFIAYVFALAGNPNHGYMATLYNVREGLPLFAKAYLLQALHEAGGSKEMQAELARLLTNNAKISPTSAHFEESREEGLAWIYHSTARTTAISLKSLVVTQPDNPLIPKVVRWLLDQQKGGHWRTTQENLYVVDALATYFAAYEKEEPNFKASIAVRGKALLEDLFSGRSLKTARAQLPMSDLTAGRREQLLITKSGPGRLYYGIRMNYFPLGESVAKEEGFIISKSIEIQDSARNLSTPLPVGTVAKVLLTVVTNQARNFVVVNDPLPAGFEPINSSFATTAVTGQPEQTETSWVFTHAEKRDDRVVVFSDYMPTGVHTFVYLARITRSGHYQMPSTRVEGMYEPEVFGQTASVTVDIR